MMKKFDAWSDVLAAAQRGDRLWYQAPFDLRPILIDVIRVFKNGKMRIDPCLTSADRFTADAGHLDRFRFEVAGPEQEFLFTYRTCHGSYADVRARDADHAKAIVYTRADRPTGFWTLYRVSNPAHEEH